MRKCAKTIKFHETLYFLIQSSIIFRVANAKNQPAKTDFFELEKKSESLNVRSQNDLRVEKIGAEKSTIADSQSKSFNLAQQVISDYCHMAQLDIELLTRINSDHTVTSSVMTSLSLSVKEFRKLSHNRRSV